MRLVEARATTCRACGAKRNTVALTRQAAKLRKAAGVSGRAMARKLKISAAYLCDIEYARRAVPPKVLAAYGALLAKED